MRRSFARLTLVVLASTFAAWSGVSFADLSPGEEIYNPEPGPCTDQTFAQFGYRVATGDLDGDGFDDMVVSRHGPQLQDRKVYIFYGSVSGQMEYTGSLDQTSWNASSVTVMDLNNDGRADVATGSGGEVRVFYSPPFPDRLPPPAPQTPDWSGSVSMSSGDPPDLASADLDRDGIADLVVLVNTVPEKAFAVYGFQWGVESGPRGPRVILAEQFRRIQNSVGDLLGDGVDEWGQVTTDPGTGQRKVQIHGSPPWLTVLGWGQNTYGQVGNGSTIQQPSPEYVLGDAREWSDIAVGNSHTLAIKADGTLWAWGMNSSGQLGTGSTADEDTPVQVGSGQIWRQVACGSSHSLALDEFGYIWAWGSNGYGQLARVDLLDRDAPAVVGGTGDWVYVGAGRSYSFGIKEDGSLWAWGQNNHGQLGDGSTSDRHIPFLVDDTAVWVMVDGGQYHTVAMREDGTLWAWGSNGFGELGDGTTAERHAPGQVGSQHSWAYVDAAHYGHFNAALRSDGTLWTWGSSGSQYPDKVGSDDDWWQVSAGYLHTSAIKEDGSLWGWGSNYYGQLGDGTTTNQAAPTRIGTDYGWRHVEASVGHTIALTDPYQFSVQVTGPAGEVSDRFGEQMGSAGDINGDGLMDVFVTDPGYDGGGPGNWGRVYVWLGASCGPRCQTGLNDGIGASHIIGPDGYDGWGRHVAVGDLDGNGYSDLAIGSSYRLGPCFNAQGGTEYAEVGMVRTILSEVSTSSPQQAASRTALHRCSPNPFNPRTTLHYELAQDGVFALRIFDVQGRLVRNLAGGSQTAGAHEVIWDGTDDQNRDVASGIYYCQLESGETKAVTKVALIR